ncbi:unnamed protein product, partial [Closterium sp. Naga37s-1]
MAFVLCSRPLVPYAAATAASSRSGGSQPGREGQRAMLPACVTAGLPRARAALSPRSASASRRASLTTPRCSGGGVNGAETEGGGEEAGAAEGKAGSGNMLRVVYHRCGRGRGGGRGGEKVGWGKGRCVGNAGEVGWVEWRVQLQPQARTVNVLPHRGDWKDCTWAIDMEALPSPPPSTSAQRGPTVWLISDCQRPFLHAPNLDRLPKGSLDLFKAHWVLADEIAVDWDYNESDYGEQILFSLHASESASLSLTEDGVQGADSVIPLTLDPAGLSPAVRTKFPLLASFTCLRLPATPLPHLHRLLASQTALACSSASGTPLDATCLQLAGALDALCGYEGPLGAHVEKQGGDWWSSGSGTVSIHVWAPTAQEVTLLLFDQPHASPPVSRQRMERGSEGQWSAQGPMAWQGMYYQYEIRVFHPSTNRIETCVTTDPYSRGLSANGERSLVVDLSDASLAPPDWSTLHRQKPPLHSFSDVSIYELHIRDFSASDPSVPEPHRGTYLAFTHPQSQGAQHLTQLAGSGLTHLHLLPAYDFGSVNEDKST